MGWASGQSPAVVAFFTNPDQSGEVQLCPARENARDRDGSGKLIRNLHNCVRR
jgi:hypothetical protein